MAFLLLDSYGKFDLTDEALCNFLTLIATGIKKTLETSAAALLNLRKELHISSQLFVVLWVSDKVNISKAPKQIKLKTANLVDFK